MAEYLSQRTTEHDTIRRWAEERGGQPARIRPTTEEASVVLRFAFPDQPPVEGEDLELISWEEFFRFFDERRMALLYRDRKSDGGLSTFSKFTSR